MKLTMQQITHGEDEIIVKYLEKTPEIERIVSLIRAEDRRLVGWQEKRQIVLEPRNILYFESVDNRTYAYTQEQVYRVDYTLAELELIFTNTGFFRCSKAMILQMHHINSLRSMSGNRIDAEMENGEHVIISRAYASAFRKKLKGEDADE